MYLATAILVVLVCFGIARQFERQAQDTRERDFAKDQARLVANIALMVTDLNTSNLALIETQGDWMMGLEGGSRLATPQALTLIQTVLGRFSDNSPAMAFFAAPEMPLMMINVGDDPTVPRQLEDWGAAYWDTITGNDGLIVVPLYADPQTQIAGLFKAYYDDGSLRGVWGLAVDIEEIVKRYVEPLAINDLGDVWIMDSAGQVIHHPQRGLIGLKVTNLHADYPELLALERRALIEPEGSGVFEGALGPGLPEGRQLMAWGKARLGEQSLIIMLAAQDDLATEPLVVHERQVLLIGLLLGITFLIAAGLFYLSRQGKLVATIDRRTTELKQLTEELEARVQLRTAELERERAQLQLVLGHMEEALIYRENGRVAWTNPAFSRLTGYTSEELRADPEGVASAIIQPSQFPEVMRAVAEALGEGHAWHGDLIMRRKDGSLFEAGVFVAQVRDEAGNPLGTVEVTRDVTEMNALRRHKDHFLSNAAHQLRLPLANLKTRLYLMRRQPEKQAHHLEVIDSSLDHLADLVSDLVDLAQYDREQTDTGLIRFDLGDLMQNVLAVWRIQGESRAVTLASDLPKCPVEMLGDYQRLNQAINNLLGYALERAPAESQVTVRMLEQEIDDLPHAQITITGLPALEQAEFGQLFEPFYHVTEGNVYNTGLRLALAQRIVTHHGGTVLARGTPDGALALIVCLPLNPAQVMRKAGRIPRVAS